MEREKKSKSYLVKQKRISCYVDVYDLVYGLFEKTTKQLYTGFKRSSEKIKSIQNDSISAL